MRSAALFAFALLFTAISSIPQDFVNDNVHRSIDLVNAVVRERRVIAIVPAKKAAAGFYYIFTQPDAQAPANCTLAYIQVKEKDAKQALEVVKEKKDVYKVKLDAKDRIVLVVDLVYFHALQPFPAEIGQMERQLIRYFGDAYMPSPYATRKQKLKVNLPSSHVESFSKEPAPVSKSGKTLTFGPYDKEQPAQASAPIYIHTEDNEPLLTVHKLTRELWLSHWGGKLAVEERYELAHEGARLKGQFSRIDFKLSHMAHEQTSVVKNLKLIWQPHVQEPYFRDDIGNVSTSHFREEKKRSVLELEPRYPLYGGWIYTWFHGYHAPLEDFVHTLKNGRYVFQADFVNGIENVPVDAHEVMVVLPEGATNIQFHLPFAVDSIEESKTFTYLDSIGRPTFTLTKKAVADEHGVPFQVSYDFPSQTYFRKPLALVTGILLIFITSMVYSRLDFSIYAKTSSGK
jgi:oligosaccharyltransferase complex subunit alpha (ribophorin I)